MAVKQRTIFEFGKMGDVPTFTHHVEGTSIILKEIASTSLKVGEYSEDNADTVFTGKELELKFQTTQSVKAFIDRFPDILLRLWCKEKGIKMKKHVAELRINISKS